MDNLEMKKQLEELDTKMELIQKNLQKKRQLNDEYKQKKSLLKSQIDEHKNELKLRNSALMKVQKQEFQQSFVPNKVERGNVDIDDIKQWQNRDGSSSDQTPSYDDSQH